MAFIAVVGPAMSLAEGSEPVKDSTPELAKTVAIFSAALLVYKGMDVWSKKDTNKSSDETGLAQMGQIREMIQAAASSDFSLTSNRGYEVLASSVNELSKSINGINVTIAQLKTASEMNNNSTKERLDSMERALRELQSSVRSKSAAS